MCAKTMGKYMRHNGWPTMAQSVPLPRAVVFAGYECRCFSEAALLQAQGRNGCGVESLAADVPG